MGKNRFFKSIFTISVCAIFVSLVLILAGKFYWDKQHPSIKKVRTTLVEYKRMNVGVFSTGIIEPMEKVKVRAKIGGILRDVKGQVGERIKKGMCWGTIDTPEVVQNLQNIERLQVELQQVDIDCQNALRKWTRLKELYLEKAVSKEMVETAEVEYNKAVVSAKFLEQQLKIEEKKKRQLQIQTKITSPISGVIMEQDIEGEMMVTCGTILFTVANLNELVVKCNIPEIDIGKITKGMIAKITTDTLPGKEFHGKVIKISPFPIKDSNLSLFEVVILIKKPFHGLQIGRSVNVEMFSTIVEKSLVVPIEAVVIKENKKILFVVKDGIVWEKEITVGRVGVENKDIEVSSGLKEGEEVCISPDEDLVEGMVVKSIRVSGR
ncbi:MAG: efflux RND transporter periplasmic adaptor subunit [bacterium]